MSSLNPRETINLATLYDEPELPWSRAAEALGEGPMGPDVACFLGTVRPDGRPHAAGVGIVAHDDAIFFTSSPAAQKAKNIAANPAVTISIRLDGIDVVFEGTAERVTDHDLLDTVTALYAKGGWPSRREGEAVTAPYSAQSAGPPPWFLYRLRIERAIGVGTRPPHGASSWRF